MQYEKIRQAYVLGLCPKRSPEKKIWPEGFDCKRFRVQFPAAILNKDLKCT